MNDTDYIDRLRACRESMYKDVTDGTFKSVQSMISCKESNKSLSILGYVCITFVLIVAALTLVLGTSETTDYTSMFYMVGIGSVISTIIIYVTRKLGINEEYINEVLNTMVDVTDDDIAVVHDYYVLNKTEYPLYIVDLMISNIIELEKVHNGIKNCQEFIDER